MKTETKIGIVRRERGFTQIENATCQDARISFKARGILQYLLSKPPGWEATISDLINASPQGGPSLRTGLKELSVFYYASLVPTFDRAGKLSGKKWEFYETPDLNPRWRKDKMQMNLFDQLFDPAAKPEDPLDEPIAPDADGAPITLDALLEMWKCNSSFQIEANFLKLTDDQKILIAAHAPTYCQYNTGRFRMQLKNYLSLKKRGWEEPLINRDDETRKNNKGRGKFGNASATTDKTGANTAAPIDQIKFAGEN